MNLLSFLFSGPKALGKVIYYRTKSRKWRWKVDNENGTTVVNPIKSFNTKIEAEQSFYEMQAIVESLPNI